MEQADKLPIRKGYECWLGKSEKEQRESGNRDRWMNRPTFILASIGSAIGLGNFWRFPYLTYKYDGAFFFFPYLCALFLMGIPLLLMELSLGQKIQRGDISVFRGMNKRLAGIGLASVFSSYIITFYYTVIIAWSSVYIVAGFINPLPWSVHNNDHDWKCDPKTTSRAEEFFYKTIVTYLDDNCKPYEDGDPTRFSLPAFGGAVFTWLTIFFCVWRGVKSSSYIVWFTVPVPIIFIIVMIINGAQLEGAGDGI
jgi:SNF family Na+-dependent transporter